MTRYKWSDEAIRSALDALVSETGRMPSSSELARRGMDSLSSAIQRNGGFLAWSERLGVSSAGGRTYWTDAMVAERAVTLSARFGGRMPTAPELHAIGENGLAAQLARRGGFEHWAQRLGLDLKGTETHWAHAWEEREAEWYREHGAAVDRMTCRHPFDMLVNGHRVDVKASVFHHYGGAFGDGYVFAGIKRGEHADFFHLVCVDGDDAVARFVVPASEARVATITIAPRAFAGRGKYAAYRDAVAPLLVAATEAA